ncbi:hypothetical protein BDE36_2626 [Arcticibacter tournemirensis]|uniref:hypothetical protein n=1 Tax=Arcticibacter tournemirensis TaxID=699437 RepID=UPI0011749415|nr:hypothetical protein [Arcticibacter tournemirensis]TQM50862.1 hypothetical protein BDE36_2626 [Arcticibacter tournemirensis]
MNDSFPILTDNQVVLSRTDVNTGILDEELIYAISPSQVVFTIYPNLIIAEDAAKLIISNRPDIECYIHNKDRVLLRFIDNSTSE